MIKALFFVFPLISGCALLGIGDKKVDKSITQYTESGFNFRFAMDGDWIWVKGSGAGVYLVGRKGSNKSSTLAAVRHGPIYTPGGKSASNKEIFAGFRRDLLKQAKDGEFKKVRSKFAKKEHKGAECLSFDQKGKNIELNTAMVNQGLVCLHPKKNYRFIMLTVSHKSRDGQLVDVSKELGQLVKTLGYN